MKYYEQATMENNSFDYLLRDLNDTVESSLEDLNDAQLKQISGGQSSFSSSSSSITINSDGSGSYSIEGFTSGNATASATVSANGETLFDGPFPSGSFSFGGFF